MKILLISPFTSQSGSAIRFWNIALGLKRKGYTVVYVDRNSKRTGGLYRSAEITYLPSPTLSPLILDILFSTLFNIAVLFRHFDCRIVYALKPAPNNCIPALIAKLLGKKIALDIDDLDYEYLPIGLKKTVSKLFFTLFPRFFPLVTCHTPCLTAYIENNLHIPLGRIYYCAQGVSHEFLRIEVFNNITVKEKSIVYVATLGITSDFDDCIPMLARLCQKHPALMITVIGDGIRRPQFEAKADGLGMKKQINFTGMVSHEELPKLMASHRIGLNYLRPSRVNDCRAILKIREYLASGCTVVCNATGDAALFKEHIFIEPDIDHIEQRLDALLSNQIESNIQGRNFVESHYSWETIIEGLVEEFRRKRFVQ